MSVLARNEIEARLAKPINDPESIVITPLLDCKFDHDAVDLRLGCYFRLPAIASIDCIRPYGTSGQKKGIVDHYSELIHKPYGAEESTLILQPHHAVLASTLEYIKMPGDVSGEILTKSSWARIFINIASAPWIHPFYRGSLTLEITNHGNVPVELPVGKKIAQLVFFRLENTDVLEKDVVEGSYAGAVMPEAPKFSRIA